MGRGRSISISGRNNRGRGQGRQGLRPALVDEALLDVAGSSSAPSSSHDIGQGQQGLEPALVTGILPDVVGSSSTPSSSHDNVSSRRVRGNAQGIPIPNNPTDRIRIAVDEDGALPKPVKRQISIIVKGHIHQPYCTWSDWKQEEKDSMWKKFLEQFTFDDEEATIKGRVAFENFLNKRYKDWFCKARTKSKKDADVIAMDEKCKDFPPAWISKHTWSMFVDIWLSEDWQNKSKIGTENRASEDHITYTGGSVTIEDHKKRLRTEKGREPSIAEVFADTHDKNPRVKTILEKYNEKVRAGSSVGNGVETSSVGEGSGQSLSPLDDLNTWVEITGGPKKGQVLGLGNHLSSSVILGSRKRASSQSVHSHIQQNMEVNVLQQMQNLEEKFESAQQNVQEQLHNVQEQLQNVQEQIPSLFQTALPSLLETAFVKFVETMGSRVLPPQPPQTNDPPIRAEDDVDGNANREDDVDGNTYKE